MDIGDVANINIQYMAFLTPHSRLRVSRNVTWRIETVIVASIGLQRTAIAQVKKSAKPDDRRLACSAWLAVSCHLFVSSKQVALIRSLRSTLEMQSATGAEVKVGEHHLHF